MQIKLSEITLITPASKAVIKREMKKLRAQVDEREAEIQILRQAMQHYVKQCDHKGQRTGHNERDGSWGNPCPTCGYSY